MHKALKIVVFPLALIIVWTIYYALPIDFYNGCQMSWQYNLYNFHTQINILAGVILVVYGIIVSFVYLPRFFAWIILPFGILAILVVMASGNVTRYISPYHGVTANMKAIQLSLERYWADNNGYYPSSLDLLKPKYFSSVPVDRSNNKNFEYHISNNAKSYILKSDVFNSCLARPTDGAHYLEGDFDGNISGANCDDPAYCVSGSNRLEN